VRRKAGEVHAVIAHGHQAHVSAGAVAGLPAEECMNNDDGGPAFPQMSTAWDDDKHEYVLSENLDGMSLRDYFAAKAMQVVHQDGGRYGPEGLAMVATQCYALADAMLKARNA
jgi:hypothetical protein